MDSEELPRSWIWFGFSALIGSMTVRIIDYWRLRVVRQFNRNADDGAVLSYPWLAQHPIWVGFVVGVLAFAVGLYLINGYARTTYLRPEAPPAAS